MKTAQEIATELLEKLKQAEVLKANASIINKEIQSMSVELNEAMTDQDCQEVTVSGIKFKPIIEQSFSMDNEQVKEASWDDNPLWFSWLKEIGEDGLIKTKQSVHAGTRAKFLKERVETKQPLPGWVKESFFSTVKYNKAAIARAVKGE